MHKIKHQIAQYSSDFPEELFYKVKMLELLETLEKKGFSRESIDAHFTASAWLIDENTKRILLLKHTKLKKWLQPGGHADGETDLEKVARKEAAEETNISQLTLVSRGIFDIDIHTIPEHRSVQAHQHYDVRFAFLVENIVMTKINSESKEFRWLNFNEIKHLTSNESILRMLKKTKMLFNDNAS